MENPTIFAWDKAEEQDEDDAENGAGLNFDGQRTVVLPPSVLDDEATHPILGRFFLTDIGFYPRASGHWRNRPQGIAQTIFIFCVRGAGWCEMEGIRMEVGAGDLLVIPQHKAHAYGADSRKPWTIYWFHLVGEDVVAFVETWNDSARRCVLGVGVEPQLLSLFEEALTTLERGYAPLQLLHSAQTLRHALSLAALTGGKTSSSSTLAIENTVRFMEGHLDKPVRVAQLAALANLSPSHYGLLFRQRIGYAPMDYFIRLRLHRACQLLDTTELSIAQVAARVGYDDPFYFSRLFKAAHQLTPFQYRKLGKG